MQCSIALSFTHTSHTLWLCILGFRSMGGMVPVRWTAPEGLTDLKYSSASDVWSFGITCVEILQDGMLPYVTVGHRYSRVCPESVCLFVCPILITKEFVSECTTQNGHAYLQPRTRVVVDLLPVYPNLPHRCGATLPSWLW